MIDTMAGDTLELLECHRALETILHTLDRIGAGLAAIHVNAAIEQLRTNLETPEDVEVQDFDPNLICLTLETPLLN